ncbi:P-type conjugative transfer protein TrbL, partial [Enterobacter hormaechei subsp. hoffmannii]|nr:P-type conjugative transfer protein TrbL [Enterobacter hormaechei subsp. hoffmannii]
NRLLIRLGVFLAIFLISNAASAAIEPDGVLDEVATRFLNESSAWGVKITEYATWLFWTLVVISMVWTFGMMALRKADIGEFFAEFVKFTITTGFFWWLLVNGPNFAMSIIDSLRTIGAEASGLPRELTPSRPIDIAFDIIAKAAKSYSITSPIDNLSIFITTLAILACMGVVAANVLLVLVSAWVMAYAGIFVLGFGGSRWTSDIAINYFRSVAGIALKLMTMTLLIGIAVSIIDGYHADLQEGAPMRELLVIFVVSMVLVVLIHSIPNVVAGLIPGGGAAAGVGNFSAGAIAGAAVGATAAVASGVATGGAALAAGGAAAAGGAQALMAAVSKAGQNVSSGSDLLSAFSGGGDGGSGGALAAAMGGTSGGGGDAGTGDTPFAQAAGFGGGDGSFSSAASSDASSGRSSSGGASNSTASASSGGGDAGNAPSSGGGSDAKGPAASGGGFLASAAKAGRVAVETGSILAQSAASGITESAQKRIGDTAGGRLAARIMEQGNTAGADEAAFGENSLAGASERDDEIAAFVNKNPRG